MLKQKLSRIIYAKSHLTEHYHIIKSGVYFQVALKRNCVTVNCVKRDLPLYAPSSILHLTSSISVYGLEHISRCIQLTFPDVSSWHFLHTVQELMYRLNTCQAVRSKYVLFYVCYVFLAGCLLPHQVVHAEGCLFSLLQLLGLEHPHHHQLLDVQHLPFLTGQDLIQISVCHHHCQDDHRQQVCRHHSYLREYIYFYYIQET